MNLVSTVWVSMSLSKSGMLLLMDQILKLEIIMHCEKCVCHLPLLNSYGLTYMVQNSLVSKCKANLRGYKLVLKGVIIFNLFCIMHPPTILHPKTQQDLLTKQAVGESSKRHYFSSRILLHIMNHWDFLFRDFKSILVSPLTTFTGGPFKCYGMVHLQVSVGRSWKL